MYVQLAPFLHLPISDAGVGLTRTLNPKGRSLITISRELKGFVSTLPLCLWKWLLWILITCGLRFKVLVDLTLAIWIPWFIDILLPYQFTTILYTVGSVWEDKWEICRYWPEGCLWPAQQPAAVAPQKSCFCKYRIDNCFIFFYGYYPIRNLVSLKSLNRVKLYTI